MESNITALIDIERETITFNQSTNFLNHLDIVIDFVTNSTIVFDNMSINIRLTSENGVQDDFIPKPGIKYDHTIGKNFHRFYFEIDQMTAYELDIDVQYNGKLFKEKLEFTPEPYPIENIGWVWKDGGWKSPTPYPTDGKLYMWNNDQLNWVLAPDELQV